MGINKVSDIVIVCDGRTVLEFQFFGTNGVSLRFDIGELQEG